MQPPKPPKQHRPIQNVIIIFALVICFTPIGVYAGLHILFALILLAGGDTQPITDLLNQDNNYPLIVISAAVGAAFGSFAERARKPDDKP